MFLFTNVSCLVILFAQAGKMNNDFFLLDRWSSLFLSFFYMLFYLFNALLKFFLRCLCSGYWMLFKLWRFMMQNLCIWRFTTYVYSRIVLYFCVKALCFYLTMYLAKSLISWNNWSSMAATMNGCGMGGMFMLISIISSH